MTKPMNFVDQMLRLENAVENLDPIDGTPNNLAPEDKAKFERFIKVGAGMLAVTTPTQTPTREFDPLADFFNSATNAVQRMGEHSGNYAGVTAILAEDYPEVVQKMIDEDEATKK